MDLNKDLNELFSILDKDSNIKEIKELKKKISKQELDLISLYRNNPTIENKKKLYENDVINKYLTCESSINYLIMAINSKFKRSKSCESNKW